MRGNFRLEQRDRLASPGFSQIVKRQAGSLARVHRRIALHVGQREIRFAIAAVSRAQQREEGRVLREGQNLPITEGPPFGRKVERKDSDFSYEWIHDSRSSKFAKGISQRVK